MKTKEKMEINRRIAGALADSAHLSAKPNVIRQTELYRRLEEKGLVRKETYNVVRPLNTRNISR